MIQRGATFRAEKPKRERRMNCATRMRAESPIYVFITGVVMMTTLYIFAGMLLVVIPAMNGEMVHVGPIFSPLIALIQYVFF